MDGVEGEEGEEGFLGILLDELDRFLCKAGREGFAIGAIFELGVVVGGEVATAW